MRRILTIPTLLLLLLVSLSVLPSALQLKQANAVTTLGPVTSITAVDGNKAPVPNGGATSSRSIFFTFTTSGGVPPYTYSCALDAKAIISCLSGEVNILALPPGKHELSVDTVDAKAEQSTSFFSWDVIGPLPTPSTTITSAVDGNGAPVQNGGTTSSPFITFTATTTGGVPPYSYTCILDKAARTCNAAQVSFVNLSTGPHQFLIQTVDAKGVKTLTPVFTWTVVTNTPPPLTSIQATQQLIQLTNSMHLAVATQQVLDAQLNSAIQSFQNNIKIGGCGHLNGFVTAVHTYLQVGRLTQTQATQLLQGVQSVEKIAGC